MYLELLGINEVSQLPTGKGKPPQDDAQVFLGVISPYSSSPFSLPTSPTFVTSPRTPTDIIIKDDKLLRQVFIPTSISFLFDLSYLNSSDLKSLILLLYSFLFDPAMPALPCINHPRFTRVNKTQYCILNPDSDHQWYIHVGQIMNYLAFDLHLRNYGSVAGFHGMPMGFTDFCTAFNTGKYPNDKCSISTVLTSSTQGDHITASVCPVLLEHFYITPEQCGLSAPKQNTIPDAHAYVFEEYATMHATRNKRRKEAMRDREEKRHSFFGRFGQSQRNNPFDSATLENNDEDDLDLFEKQGTTAINQSASGSTTTPTVPVEDQSSAIGSSSFKPSVRLLRGTKGKSSADQMVE